MHARTWLSLITLPLVAAFTYPMVVQPQPEPRKEAKTSQDPLGGISDIQDVLALVRQHYVDAPDMEKVVSGGIQGALERAHPSNAYLSPEDLSLPDPGSANPGLALRKSQIYAQVIAVTPGSSAEKAGLHVGDVVRKLDGASLGPLSAWKLERSLLGAPGTTMELLCYDSQSGQTRTVTVTRERPARPALALRKEAKASVVTFSDLSQGRVQEFKNLAASLDPHLPLVLDLRRCNGGDLNEAARLAGYFFGPGPFATFQEAGKTETSLLTEGPKTSPFAKVVLLSGVGTVGPGELLVAAFRKQGAPTFGDRTAGMGFNRTRIALRQGGAVELVNRRWTGAGGEKLDRQGVTPEHFWRGLKADEDLLPRILDALEQKAPPKAEDKSLHARVGRLADSEMA
ncbi:MAG: S41 family peptidase [Firmicutes bacterium]|nr:S41 family peptidase [Bacillota bacterium]